MDSPASSTGEIVAGHFRLIAPLGAGAMGSVWRALDVKSGREVALKYIHPELTAHPSIVERFRREMAITARIHSPYTVAVYEVGSASDGRQYLAMELVSGKSLASVLAEQGALPPTRIVRVGAQVAEALAAAHAVGVIHRDLKPDNIMLYERSLGSGGHVERDRVKVLDFGVARLVDNGPVEGEENWQTLTRQGSLVGTPRYMAPEQISFEPVTTRTDLYALGVVLYEMAVGKPPFPCNSVREALNEHLFEEPVPPTKLLEHPFPASLERIILALLAKEPKERPQHASDVAALLNEALTSTAPAPEPSTPLPGGMTRVPSVPALASSGTLVPDLSMGTLVPDLGEPSRGTIVPDVGSAPEMTRGTLVPDIVRGTLVPDAPRGTLVPDVMVQTSSRTMVPEAELLDEILREIEAEAPRQVSKGLHNQAPDDRPTVREEAMRDFDSLMSARGPLRSSPSLPELGDEAEPTELVDRGVARKLVELDNEDAATQLADEEASQAIRGKVMMVEDSTTSADDTLLPDEATAKPAVASGAAMWWETPLAWVAVIGLTLVAATVVWWAMG